MGSYLSVSQTDVIPITFKVEITNRKDEYETYKHDLPVNYNGDNLNDVITASLNWINKQVNPAKYELDIASCGPTIHKVFTFLIRKNDTLYKAYSAITVKEEYDAFMDKYASSLFDDKDVLLTTFNKDELKQMGLQLGCRVSPYKQNINACTTCPHLLQSENKNEPSNCPNYKEMKQFYLWNQENFNHLCEYQHFEVDEQKPQCKYGEKCRAYIRVKNGQQLLKDRCHLKLFRHPPRSNHITLSKTIHPFTYTSAKQSVDPFTVHNMNKMANKEEEEKYIVNKLIEEVVRNGYKKDLCLDKDVDFKNDDYTLMDIVAQKKQHPRHQRMGAPLSDYHLLALLLYTGCDCNHNLCLSQRQGDYEKWKIFDWCLNAAIHRLSLHERGSFCVYSGVCGAKFKSKTMDMIYLPTFTSTSWNKTIAQMFVGAEGAILEFDKELRERWPCCDVSWISDFDEYEILFSRIPPLTFEIQDFYHGLCCQVIDDDHDIQTVSVTMKKMKNKKYQEKLGLLWNQLL